MAPTNGKTQAKKYAGILLFNSCSYILLHYHGKEYAK